MAEEKASLPEAHWPIVLEIIDICGGARVSPFVYNYKYKYMASVEHRDWTKQFESHEEALEWARRAVIAYKLTGIFVPT